MMQYHSRLRRSSTAEAHMGSGSDVKLAETDSASHEVQHLVSVMKLSAYGWMFSGKPYWPSNKGNFLDSFWIWLTPHVRGLVVPPIAVHWRFFSLFDHYTHHCKGSGRTLAAQSLCMTCKITFHCYFKDKAELIDAKSKHLCTHPRIDWSDEFLSFKEI